MPHAMYFTGNTDTVTKINHVPYQTIVYNENGMFTTKLMNDTSVEIFIDNGATPSILPLHTYNKFPILHTYAKTESNTPIHTGGGLIHKTSNTTVVSHSITPYYGSSTYHYLHMGMGMNVSPQIWQQFVDLIFKDDLIKGKQNFDVIMDDTFIHLTAEEHMDDLMDLFKVLRKYGLKLSPHKCQFFKKKIV